MNVQVYMAGPLVSAEDQQFNRDLVQLLRNKAQGLDFILLQEESAKFSDLRSDCFSSVRRCDLVVARLNGAEAHAGTCIEVGFALALNKIVVGYRTDLRTLDIDGTTGMLMYGVSQCVGYDADRSLNVLAQRLIDAINGRLSQSFICKIERTHNEFYTASVYDRLSRLLYKFDIDSVVAAGHIISMWNAESIFQYLVQAEVLNAQDRFELDVPCVHYTCVFDESNDWEGQVFDPLGNMVCVVNANDIAKHSSSTSDPESRIKEYLVQAGEITVFDLLVVKSISFEDSAEEQQ